MAEGSDFFGLFDREAPARVWGSAIERERYRRIAVAVWAYAYEIEGQALVPDNVYDEWARQIDPSVSTGRNMLDEFFRTEFSPHTGMWVHVHPHKDRLGELAQQAREWRMSYGVRVEQ